MSFALDNVRIATHTAIPLLNGYSAGEVQRRFAWLHEPKKYQNSKFRKTLPSQRSKAPKRPESTSTASQIE